jgi:hypothetical protein
MRNNREEPWKMLMDVRMCDCIVCNERIIVDGKDLHKATKALSESIKKLFDIGDDL